jgi:hypothetical protein
VIKKALLFVVPVAVLLATPSAAWADATICTGVLVGVHDSVIVPPGATCIMTAATVRHNVRALENSRLEISNSTIGGNLDGDGADSVKATASTVRGNIQIMKGGPALPPPGIDSAVFLQFLNLPSGNIHIKMMTGRVQVVDNELPRGHIKIEDNDITDFLEVGRNQVGQHLQAFRNTGGGSKFVWQNMVGDKISCKDNAPPFFGGLNVASKYDGQCTP